MKDTFVKRTLREWCGVFDMRASAARTPRNDGGRWMVRKGARDIYTKTFLGALWVWLLEFDK